MTPEAFWILIEEARHSTKRAVEISEWLAQHLSRRDNREIIGFQARFRDCLYRSYDANLWLSANIIMGHCPEKRFDHFRAWLVSRGQNAFESALDDPDSMAAWPNFDGEFGTPRLEGLLEAAPDAYVRRVGGYRNVVRQEFEAQLPPAIRPLLRNEELRGVSDEDARSLLPKLAARFPAPLAARRDK